MTKRNPEAGNDVPPVSLAPEDVSNQGRSVADAVYDGAADLQSASEKKAFSAGLKNG